MTAPGVEMKEEGRGLMTAGGELQEEVRVVPPGGNLQEEVRVPGASSEGARYQGARPKGSSTHMEVPNPLNKTQNNLELFERSIVNPNVAKAINAYDDRPETRISYKLMYDELLKENQSLTEIIKHGRVANTNMQAKLVQYEKAFQACDTKTTEKLLETNVGIKNETEFLRERVKKQNEEIDTLRDVVKELTDDSNKKDITSTPRAAGTLITQATLVDEDTEILQVDAEAAEEVNVSDLLKMKKSGHDRVSPQVLSQPKSTEAKNTEFKCGVCKLVRDSKAKLERHMKNHNDDGDWTCDGCAYQTSEESNLLNHLLEKRDHSTKLLDHLLNKNVYERREKCTLCGDLFQSKTNLHDHLLIDHRTYKPCNKIPSCTGLECRFNHKEVGKDVHLCYQCGDEFNSRIGLMEHMKNNHEMPPCKHFRNGNCTFRDKCWYSHKFSSDQPANPPSITSSRPNQQPASGFWQPSQNHPPPLRNTMEKQQLMNKMMEMNQKFMKEMMTQMNQQMMTMMNQMK